VCKFWLLSTLCSYSRLSFFLLNVLAWWAVQICNSFFPVICSRLVFNFLLVWLNWHGFDLQLWDLRRGEKVDANNCRGAGEEITVI
jgi:hypothetical protein